MDYRLRVLFLVSAALFLGVMACDLSLARDLAENIDTSPTDCSAEVFVATIQEDVFDGVCNSHCSLREAIVASNTCEGAQRIELPEAEYTLSRFGGGAQRGDLDIWDSVTIEGTVGPDLTLIKTRPGWGDRVFDILSAITVVIEDVEITGGSVPEGDGGGILNRADLTLVNVNINGNRANRGGGIYNQGVARLNQTWVSSNEATASYNPDWRGGEWFDYTRYPPDRRAEACGGGINNVADMYLRESQVDANMAAIGAGICQQFHPSNFGMQIIDSRIVNNGITGRAAEPETTSTIFGGGIAAFGFMDIRDSEVAGNRAVTGAGMYVSSTGGDVVMLSNVNVERNDAWTQTVDTGRHRDSVPFLASGGGIHLHAGGLQILDSLIKDNTSQYFAAGISIDGPAEAGETWLALYESAIVGNETRVTIDGVDFGIGAGLVVNKGSVVEAELRNVTISGNRAANYGHGVLIEGGGWIHFNHVTVFDNPGDRAGFALLVDTAGGATINASHSIFGAASDRVCGPSVAMQSNGYNMVPADQCIRATDRQPTDYDPDDEGDYSLWPLSELDGTWIHPVPPGSWAMERVPTDVCGSSENIDQVHNSRPAGDACEVGAYEMVLEASSATIPTPATGPTETPQSVPTVITDSLCWRGPGSLYEVVSALTIGAEVQILGRGVEGDWWVIDNPRYPGVRCWTPGDDIEVQPNYDFPNTLFEIPPLPTATPQPGCLWYDQQQQEACFPIDACPVDFENSLGACTP